MDSVVTSKALIYRLASEDARKDAGELSSFCCATKQLIAPGEPRKALLSSDASALRMYALWSPTKRKSPSGRRALTEGDGAKTVL